MLGLMLIAGGLGALVLSGALDNLTEDIGDVRPDIPGGEIATGFEDESGAVSQMPTFDSPVHENYGVGADEMRTSDAGRAMIENLEGFSAKAYSDHKGYSIGYGHLIRAGDGLARDSIVSRDKADALMTADLAIAENAVNAAIDVELTQSQFDALVSFCYNVGTGAFSASTLVRKINTDDPTAANEFARWNRASGSVNKTLVARRNTERQLFLA